MRIVYTTLLMFVIGYAVAQDTTIKKSDLMSSAKVFDMRFTQKEIDTLYSDVLDNVLNYQAMHKLSLNNSVPLSLWQNPVVPGMTFNKIQKPIIWNKVNASVPTNKNDLAFYSIEQLAFLLKNKKNKFG